MANSIDGVSHVDADELQQWMNDPARSDVYFVDIRELNEYQAGHIPGVPLLPMGEIPDVADQLDKNAEYVFICRSGNRSLNVAKYLQGEGIARVHNFEGGMLSWLFEIATGEDNEVGTFTSMAQLKRKL